MNIGFLKWRFVLVKHNPRDFVLISLFRVLERYRFAQLNAQQPYSSFRNIRIGKYLIDTLTFVEAVVLATNVVRNGERFAVA